MPKKLRLRFHPTDTIGKLAASSLISDLSAVDLVIYLRLLAAVDRTAKQVIGVINSELAKDPRTARNALGRLESAGLITVRHPKSGGREIEVLR